MSLGVAQGQIAELTSISQGRLSEWKTRKRAPRARLSVPVFCGRLVERIVTEAPQDWDTSLLDTDLPDPRPGAI
jgi:hypothetical protein